MSPIIIVDNNKDDCDFLIESLKDEGANAGFLCFSSSVPALEYLKTTKDRPSLIISDVHLPQISGLSFKRSINDNWDLYKKNIPFFFFSSSKNADQVDEALCLSVDGYFRKPDNITDFDIVAKQIKQYLERHPFRDKDTIN
jgi:CheY-like chemotaxis protein